MVDYKRILCKVCDIIILGSSWSECSHCKFICTFKQTAFKSISSFTLCPLKILSVCVCHVWNHKWYHTTSNKLTHPPSNGNIPYIPIFCSHPITLQPQIIQKSKKRQKFPTPCSRFLLLSSIAREHHIKKLYPATFLLKKSTWCLNTQSNSTNNSQNSKGIST